jgi:uncharacterized protein (DUF305 family)
MTPPRITAVLLLCLCAGALPAAVPAHDHAKTGHDHGAMAAGKDAASTGMYSAADLAFLTHMIVHHQQALELCALVVERSQTKEFHRFARYLNDAQQSEIAQMRALLDQAAARGATIPEIRFHADPPMAGMLSSTQMAAIRQARGAEFERLWLEGMILHHQGAVDMALAQQEAQFRNRNQPFGLDTLVDEMLVVQRGEIGKMKEWLVAWR